MPELTGPDTGLAREEGNKSSDQSPNYPTPGTPHSLSDTFFFAADHNKQLGKNMDTDEWDEAKLKGWHTWRKPTVEYCWLRQFAFNEGVICVAKLTGGDVFRTGVRFIVREGSHGGSAAVAASVRFAAEFNSLADRDEQYCHALGGFWSPLHVQGLDQDAGLDPNTWGDFTIGEILPSVGDIPDPTSGAKWPELVIAFVHPTLAADNVTSMWLEVQTFDGREFDTLDPDVRAPAIPEYDLVEDDFANYTKGEIVQGSYVEPPYYDEDNDGEGSIILYDGIGGLTEEAVSTDQFQLAFQQMYRYFLQGLVYHWFYVQNKTDDMSVGHPYWPGDNVPAGHPYEGQVTEDEFETFEFNKWVRKESYPLIFDALIEQGKTYEIWWAPYSPADLDRYDEGSGFFVSAPVKFGPGELPSIEVTTTTEKLLTPYNLSHEGMTFSALHALQWDHDGPIADDFVVDVRLNDGLWESEGGTTEVLGYQDKVNWESADNPKSVTVQVNTAMDLNNDTMSFRIRAKKDTFTDSNWSLPVTFNPNP